MTAEVYKNIAERRSVTKVLDTPVERDVIERILTAACWAPSHYRTYPWRFTVFEGEGRHALAEAMAMGAAERTDGTPSEKEEKAAMMYQKAFRAPVIITVHAAVGRSKFKNPPTWEDIAATCAASQNLLLAASAEGLGAIWRSGDVVNYPAVQELLKLDVQAGDTILGYVYVGHPDPDADAPMRPAPKVNDFVTYIS